MYHVTLVSLSPLSISLCRFFLSLPLGLDRNESNESGMDAAIAQIQRGGDKTAWQCFQLHSEPMPAFLHPVPSWSALLFCVRLGHLVGFVFNSSFPISCFLGVPTSSHCIPTLPLSLHGNTLSALLSNCITWYTALPLYACIVVL